MVDFSMATYNIVKTDIIVCKMYYNKIDKEHEGFYPELKRKNGYESVNIKFQLCYYRGVDIYWWTQVNESVIYGFTHKTGKELLDILNSRVIITVERDDSTIRTPLERAVASADVSEVNRNVPAVNSIFLQMTAKKIYNSGGRCIYPLDLIDSTFYLMEKDMYIK